ncbi:prolyl endopeptidase FAP-like [Stylophora pistillata]|uniref:prolyl endopeptidase FAP-like n=1 Tax=Stylophora pistillata TaxID=50429 RepID=UPI000C0543E0|nr:prolyl endopeptidase FAP-like [Stylophora pistillata]
MAKPADKSLENCLNMRFKRSWKIILAVFLSSSLALFIIVAIVVTRNQDREDTRGPESLKKPFRFDDIFNGYYSYSTFPVRWKTDDTYIRYSKGNLTVTNVSKTETVLFSDFNKVMVDFNVSNYWISSNGKWVLLASNRRKLYRRSFFADYYVHNFEKGSTSQVIPPDPNKQIQLAIWGNNDTSIGFVQDNNIYWLDKIGGTVHTITENGKENELFNGVPDWVYEEDVTSTNVAMWFSPDGRYLVYAQSNDTQVKWFPYMWYGKYSDMYTTVKKIAYPKPGSPNPVVKIKMVDLNKLPTNESQVPNTMDLNPPAEFTNIEHYYTNVGWASSTKVLIWWLNRVQDTFISSICDAPSGRCAENQKTQVTNGWVDTKTYLLDISLVLIHRYFQSAETSPRDRHIYSVNVKTKEKKCLSCSLPWAKNGDCKYFSASFSLEASWYILTCYGPNLPRVTLHKTKSSAWYKELEMNRALEKKMSELAIPKRRNFKIPAGKYDLLATEFLPPNFDENKKYAVHFEVYGGPGSQRVTELFLRQLGWVAYLVSNFDIIVVMVDGRGTGNRGESFKQAVYKLLGEYEAQDVITAGRYMQEKKYVDPKKLSVWGWSFGGFLTSYVLSKNSSVFKCGIAVAPVTDWRYYDSAYTERYMGVPKENEEGYRYTSLLSRAAKFSNVDYLIIHGAADDNVHYQHTAQMVRALTEAEVKFRVQYYTDKDHGIVGFHTRRHLYRLMTNFLTRSLGLTYSKQ